MKTRIEQDTMGEVEVPEDALYGAQTARAVAAFPVSGQGIGRDMIQALGWIKQAAAMVNLELGKLDRPLAEAIAQAAAEVAEGQYDDHFPVDLFQTGSGTNSNMNANEVIANLAARRLGGTVGERRLVHPNDHVNLGQSSNDVFPSAIHLAAVRRIRLGLLPALDELRRSFEAKAAELDHVVKIGRTHLQDATPIRLGQELSGYAAQLGQGAAHIEASLGHLGELALGGTAVGTGLNTHPEFGARMASRLVRLAGLGEGSLVEAPNHFEAQGAQDACVQASGAMKTLAVSLLKIASDLRLLSSGPRLGLGELCLPALLPGSSIMPGKVNPVIAESVIQVCAQVIGNDTAITWGGAYGVLELNTMLPLISRNLLEQVRLLSGAMTIFREKLVEGMEADTGHIEALRDRSLALVTALVPHIGYDAAAELAKACHASGRTVREVALEQGLLPPEELELALDLRRQTGPTG